MSKKRFFRILIAALLVFTAGLLFINKNKNNPDRIFTVTTFAVENGWGYRIYKQDTLFIEQPTIPGIIGNQGFHSEEKAKEIGVIITQKLKDGIFPPTISEEELRAHGVVLNRQ
jgi:hypothetical protein